MVDPQPGIYTHIAPHIHLQNILSLCLARRFPSVSLSMYTGPMPIPILFFFYVPIFHLALDSGQTVRGVSNLLYVHNINSNRPK